MKRSTFKVMLFALFGMALSLAIVSCSSNNDDTDYTDNTGNTGDDDDSPVDNPDPWANKKAKYTIMLYGCGGGDVDGMYENAIPQIIDALNVSSNQVRFTVMFNTSKDASRYAPEEVPDLYGDWGTCYRYELTPQTDLTKQGYRSKYKYKNASEVPLYKTSTLVEYINWVKQTAPAENYILMPVNHGGGTDISQEVTRAIVYDDNHVDESGYPFAISQGTIAEALKQTNTHLKAIYWCGCMMGQLEVLTQLAPYCDYQFCSSHVSRAIPSLVSNIVYAINNSPDDFENAALLDKQFNDADYNRYFIDVPDANNPEVLHNENCDWGCWRSNKLADINAQVKKLATLLCNNYNDPTKMGQIDYATALTYVFEYDRFYVDVLDYAVNLAERLDEGQNATAKQIVTDMENALNAAMVYHNGYINVINSKGEKIAPKKGFYSLGISIYSSQDLNWLVYGANYKTTDFDKATGWSKFLDINTVGVRQGDTNPANNSSWDLGYLEIE